MYCAMYLTIAVGVVLTLVQNGNGLQCWKCSSSQDVNCRDYFNITKIKITKRYFDNANYGNRQIQPVGTDPHVEVCDEKFTTDFYKSKNVCMKLVYKGIHGINEVLRGCSLIQKSHQSRTCPEDLYDKRRSIQACEICESDQCNTAGIVKTNMFFVTAIPTVVALLLRK